MKFSVKEMPSEKYPQDCQIIGLFEDAALSGTAKKIDQNTGGALSKLIKDGAFMPKRCYVLPLFSFAGSEYKHILLVGCGKKAAFNESAFKRAVIEATRSLDACRINRAICYLAELDCKNRSLAWKTKQIVLGMNECLYRFDRFKSQKNPGIALKDVIIDIPQSNQLKACARALQEAEATAAGMQLTKDLGNLPSNVCTPKYLAQEARKLAKTHASINTKILGEKEMTKLGMGALLGVSKGSPEEAQLICMEYNGAGKKQKPVCLVGKGVTFDTGGNSLKPPDSMVGMKYDMCGAATVFGVIKAAALLKLPINIVGVIPAVENVPGGAAYKPEDILTSLSGQTIEVISTDAEGRLALCDALTYCERYQPAVVIDIATLTGAVVIALSFHVTGLMSNNETLAKDLLKAGLESNDRAWEFPLYEEFDEQIKSPFADMANVGGRPGGVVTAGSFLARFTKNMVWAHLDVAGTAALMMGGTERRATGRPVPMLMQYIIDRAEKHA